MSLNVLLIDVSWVNWKKVSLESNDISASDYI